MWFVLVFQAFFFSLAAGQSVKLDLKEFSGQCKLTCSKNTTISPTPTPTPAPVAGAPKWINGYILGYQMDMIAPEKLPWAKLTHATIGLTKIDTVNTALTPYFALDNARGADWVKRVRALATTNKVKLMLMIGGSHEPLENWQKASKNPVKFATSIVTLAKSLKMDGVDFDWEPLLPNDAPALNTLVAEVRKQWPTAILTFAANWMNQNEVESNDAQTVANLKLLRQGYTQLATLIDQFNIMSYAQYYGAGGWKSWHTSALKGNEQLTPSSVSSAVNFYLSANVPRAKLGVGTGFFGACYTNVTAPRQSIGEYTNIFGDGQGMSYLDIVTKYLPYMQYSYDKDAESPYLSSNTPVGVNGCKYISYENATSIKAKTEYLKAEKLGGQIIWSVADGSPELLDAMK
jgi:chitinase